MVKSNRPGATAGNDYLVDGLQGKNVFDQASNYSHEMNIRVMDTSLLYLAVAQLELPFKFYEDGTSGHLEPAFQDSGFLQGLQQLGLPLLNDADDLLLEPVLHQAAH